jgi:acyl carrier protein
MPGEFDAFTAVRDAVAVVCEVEPEGLVAATRFDELGADSLSRVSIADVVEADAAEHHVSLPRIDDAVLCRMATLADLVEHLGTVRLVGARPRGGTAGPCDPPRPVDG